MLARRANRHGTLDISKALGGWLFDAELVGSSARYNDVDNTAKLAGYALMNFVADYKINSDWSVQGRVNNILDKDYTLASKGSIWGPGPSYNTPGANVFFSLRYSPSY
jgi:vitamin B12 transporter